MHIAKGRRHDFRVFKESRIRIRSGIKVLADSGYQGLQKLHGNTILPVKGTKKRPLTKENKEHNHELGSQRIPVEHAIGCMKNFKIITYPYRNRRKRFGLRINLIAAICNLHLQNNYE